MRWERDMQIEDLRDHPTELIVQLRIYWPVVRRQFPIRNILSCTRLRATRRSFTCTFLP